MSAPFVAEIRIFGFQFAPTGWAQCNGQLLPISQNTALFSLLGTFYGGDGKSTFALPNFESSAAIGQGTSTTGTTYDLGQTGGSASVTLLQSELPAHSHLVRAVGGDPGELQAPAPNRAIARSANGFAYVSSPLNAQFAPQTLSPTGGSQPHNNMQPYLVLNFCIALQGVFPPRG
jgi:microcystin-dependent protein